MESNLLSQHDGFYVWNDGLLYKYGTKERALNQYMKILKDEGYNHVTYVGPGFAVGGYAIAKTAQDEGMGYHIFLVGKENICFLDGIDVRRITYVTGDMRRAYAEHEDYTRRLNRRRRVRNTEIRLGLDDERYIQLLIDSFRNDQELVDAMSGTGDVWISVGSGVVLSALLSVFPDKVFHAVTVTSKKPNWIDGDDRVFVYSSPLKAMQKVETPFPSIPTYDAKVWPVMKEHGKEGDIMFNIAVCS